MAREVLVGVQYPRALAALLVLYFHAAVNAQSGPVFGETGVDVFFVISGFLMWAVTDDQSRAGPFLLKRIQRIVPLYWIATTTVMALALAGFTGRVQPDLVHYLKSLFFIPYVGPTGPYPMLNIGWTLNYEMFFYAVFAALLRLPRQSIPPVLTALFGALCLLGPTLPGDPVIAFYTNPIILEFVAGVWLAVFIHKTPGRQTGFLLLILGGFGLVADSALPRIVDAGVPAILCVWGTLAIERDGGVPMNTFAKVTGDASYSLYVWHVFPIALIRTAVLGMPYATTMLFIVGLAAGIASWFLLERPILDRFKRAPRLRTAPRQERVKDAP